MLVVEVTEHAIKRYGERVRPALEASQLENEVLHVIEDAGVITWHAPEWTNNDDAIVGWVMLGPDVALPLEFHRKKRGVLVAVTCLIRGSYGPVLREAANRQHRIRRARRAAKRRNSYVPGARQVA